MTLDPIEKLQSACEAIRTAQEDADLTLDDNDRLNAAVGHVSIVEDHIQSRQEDDSDAT